MVKQVKGCVLLTSDKNNLDVEINCVLDSVKQNKTLTECSQK